MAAETTIARESRVNPVNAVSNASGKKTSSAGESSIERTIKSDLEKYGSAFLDWGLGGEKNIGSEEEAVKIANKFNDDYYVYYQLMGYGGRIPAGTPVAIRISNRMPSDSTGYLSYQFRHHSSTRNL